MNVKIPASLAASLIGLAALAPAQAPSRFVQVQLENTIKSKKAKVGDKVKAKAIADAALANGPKIAAGDEFLGHVRAVEPDSLAISFDEVTVKGKRTPLALSIRAAMMPGASASEREGAVAESGAVIGMPGVTLHIDDTPQHASKFQSTGKDLQLKEGLNLMLGAPEGTPAP